MQNSKFKLVYKFKELKMNRRRFWIEILFHSISGKRGVHIETRKSMVKFFRFKSVCVCDRIWAIFEPEKCEFWFKWFFVGMRSSAQFQIELKFRFKVRTLVDHFALKVPKQWHQQSFAFTFSTAHQFLSFWEIFDHIGNASNRSN